MSDFTSSYYADQEKRKADAKASILAKADAKASILAKADALKAHGVRCVVAEFSGSGDEGYIGEVKFFGEVPEDFDEDGTVAPDTIPDIAKPDESAFDALLPDGYEINDGGQGTVVFDVEAKKITINMGWNYDETRDESSEV